MVKVENDYIITNHDKILVSNGSKIKSAIDFEIDIVEPSLICIGNAETTKVVAIGDYSREYLLKVFKEVIKRYECR